MLAASQKATDRSIALIADAATSALIKAQRAQNASESASQSSVKASQRLQAAADKADKLASRLEKGLYETINRTALKAIHQLNEAEKSHEIRLAQSTKDLETAAQTITRRSRRCWKLR